jgi:fengycin family lipopeptide synthetase D
MVPFDLIDIEGDDSGETVTEEYVQHIVDRFIRPFDLGRAPMLRVGLLKVSEQEQLLICDMHHIVNDAASLQLFYVEFRALYAGRELAPMKLRYKDFAAWQNDRLNRGELRQQEQYWLSVFPGEIPRLNMPTDYPRPLVQSFVGGAVKFEMDKEEAANLYEIASPIGATLNMVLFSIYFILLYKYTGQEDIVVGSSAAGRPHADLQNVIGFFINTLAIRTYPNGEKTFLQFLEEVKNTILKTVENQDYQFDDLVSCLGIPRDTSRQPLFDTHFTLHKVYMDHRDIARGSDGISRSTSGSRRQASNRFVSYIVEEKITQFDIIIHAIESNNGIIFLLSYCAKLFKKETMQRFVDYYCEIARIVVENKNIKLKDIKISHQLERARANMPSAEFNF